MGKTLHVGIDQTGAIDRSGTPHPLPACLINGQEVTFFYLDSFSKKDLLKNIKSINNLVICVDCVLGLPQELALPWRKTLELIQAHQGYGRIPAKNFFLSLSDGRIIRRQIEIACNANSVFKEKPFQKNIQTGTYRIWKDIAKAPADFAVPFLMEVPKKNQIPIYEGYPTLSWKLLFNLKFRQPEKFFDLYVP